MPQRGTQAHMLSGRPAAL